MLDIVNNFNSLIKRDGTYSGALLIKIADDFRGHILNNNVYCGNTYEVTEPIFAIQFGLAKKALLKELNEKLTIKKIAFDTRRIDQEKDRNPRGNLQYWHRSQQFIDEEDKIKIDIFGRLIPVLDSIKSKYGTSPEYHNSYIRTLNDTVRRSLKLDAEDLDISKAQLNYLEQLLFARYRLSMDDIKYLDKFALEHNLLSKDESLLKHGIVNQEIKPMVKDGNGVHESIVNAIFGSQIRQPGDRSVTRTITITINDKVME